MDHVATDVDGQITADGARLGLEGLGGSDQLTGTGDHAMPSQTIATTPDDEIGQAGEEGTFLVHAVVLFRQFTAGGQLLQAAGKPCAQSGRRSHPQDPAGPHRA